MEADEVTVLERTEIRLASLHADDAGYARALERVLPRLVPLAGRAGDSPVRAKCLEVLARIHSHLRASPSIQVPVQGLLDVMLTVPAAAAPLAAMFVVLGVQRLAPARRVVYLAQLIDTAASSESTSSASISVAVILTIDTPYEWSVKLDDNRAWLDFNKNDVRRKTLVDLLLDLLLIPPRTSNAANSNETAPTCPGLSARMWAAIYANIDREPSQLARHKSNAISIMTSGAIPADEIALHALVAKIDPHHLVSSQYDQLPRRVGSPNFENSVVVDNLVAFYLGNSTSTCGDARISPSLPLKMEIINSLSRSKLLATESFPSVLKIVFDSAFGSHSYARLIVSSLHLLLFSLQHAPKVQLVSRIVAALLQSLLKLLEVHRSAERASHVDSSSIRGLCYEAVAQLADVSPEPSMFTKSLQLPKYFFTRLADEYPTVQHAVQGSLSVLGTVFAANSSLDDAGTVMLRDMLVELTESSDNKRIRLCSLQWLNRVFSFDDMACRHACLQLVDDPEGEVRDEAARGLLPRSNARYPKLSSFIKYERSRKQRLLAREQNHGESPQVLARTLLFSQECLLFPRKEQDTIVDESQEALELAELLEIALDLRLFPSERPGVPDLIDTATKSFRLLLAKYPVVIGKRLVDRIGWLEVLLMHGPFVARFEVAQMLSLLGESDQYSVQLDALLEKLVNDPDRGDDGSVHGALLGMGALVKTSTNHSIASSCLDHLIASLSARQSMVQSAAANSISKFALQRELTDVTREKILPKLRKLGQSDVFVVAEESIRALGALGASSLRGRAEVLAVLFEFSNLRDEQLTFACGKAIADATIPHGDIALDEFFERIIGEMLPPESSSALARSSAAVWLMVMIHRCEQLTDRRLDRIQSAFIKLLPDPRVLTQEVACKGLALLNKMHAKSAELQSELLRSLVRGFGRAEIDRAGATIVIPFGAYRELCTVASEIGYPQIIYELLDVSCTHVVWSSPCGLEYSLSSLESTTRLLVPQLKRLVPKLFRFQFHPNTKIRSTLRTLWRAMVTDDNPHAVKDHFDLILGDLCESLMGSRDTSVREASITALSDLLQLHRPRPEQVILLLGALFRALDDIDEKVRLQAVNLAITLTSNIERICDADSITTSNSMERADAAALLMAQMIPFLLEKGLQSKCQDICSCSIALLTRIVGCGGRFLRPHVPVLVTALLESLASLENPSMNYAMFHVGAEKKEQLESLRLQMTQASPLASALLKVEKEIADFSVWIDVVERVTVIIRRGIGLPTLQAASDLAMRLVERNAETFAADASADSFVSKLINALIKCLLDDSNALRKAFATSMARVCNAACIPAAARNRRLAFVDNLVTRLLKMHDEAAEAAATAATVTTTTAQSANAESRRQAVAYSIGELCRYARSTLETALDRIIPLAYVGLHDRSDAIASEEWGRVFDECTAGRQTGVRQYLNAIKSRIQFELTTQQSYSRRVASLLALSDLVEKLENQFEPGQILVILLDMLEARLVWEGKEVLPETFAVIVRHCHAKLSIELMDQALTALSDQLNRSRTLLYKISLFNAFGVICEFAPSVDGLSKVRVELETLLAPSSAERMDLDLGDSDDNQDKKMQDRLVASVWQDVHRNWVFDAIISTIVGRESSVRITALSALRRLFATMDLSRGPSDTQMLVLITKLLVCIHDLKYMGVRLASLKALLALLERQTSNHTDVNRLVAPHHATLLNAMHKKAGDRSVDVSNYALEAKAILLKISRPYAFTFSVELSVQDMDQLTVALTRRLVENILASTRPRATGLVAEQEWDDFHGNVEIAMEFCQQIYAESTFSPSVPAQVVEHVQRLADKFKAFNQIERAVRIEDALAIIGKNTQACDGDISSELHFYYDAIQLLCLISSSPQYCPLPPKETIPFRPLVVSADAISVQENIIRDELFAESVKRTEWDDEFDRSLAQVSDSSYTDTDPEIDEPKEERIASISHLGDRMRIPKVQTINVSDGDNRSGLLEFVLGSLRGEQVEMGNIIELPWKLPERSPGQIDDPFQFIPHRVIDDKNLIIASSLLLQGIESELFVVGDQGECKIRYLGAPLVHVDLQKLTLRTLIEEVCDDASGIGYLRVYAASTSKDACSSAVRDILRSLIATWEEQLDVSRRKCSTFLQMCFENQSIIQQFRTVSTWFKTIREGSGQGESQCWISVALTEFHIAVCQSIQINDRELSQIAVRLFGAAFWPYLDSLDKWMLTGTCERIGPGQDFLIEPKGDTYDLTSNPANIPTILRGDIARKVLVTGRAARIVHQLKLAVNLDLVTLEMPLSIAFSSAFEANAMDSLTEPTDSFLKDCVRRPILEIYNRVNDKLLSHIHKHANLLQHLTALRRLYFMECGDVASHFVVDLFELMNDARSESSWLDARVLNDLLQRAISYSVFHSLLEGRPVQLSVCYGRFASDGKGANSSEVDQLSRIRLDYEMPWPLSEIVTQREISLYQRVFTFLLQLLRAKHVLNRMARLRGVDVLREFHFLRWKIQHFISTVYHYVMNRIVFHLWREVPNKLLTASDIEQLSDEHRSYLESVLRQALLSPQADAALQCILDVIRISTDMFEVYVDHVQRGSNTELLRARIQRINRKFESSNRFLLTVLSQIIRRGAHPFIEDVYLRLNFNLYYSVKAT